MKVNLNPRQTGTILKQGMGPCDGIGSTVKRLAEDAVTQNKAVIQDPSDFFAWSQETQSESKITYLFVSSEETKICRRITPYNVGSVLWRLFSTLEVVQYIRG